MSGTLVGRIGWGLDTDDEGQRTYMLRQLVRMDTLNEGPLTALNTAGLPTIGSSWNQGGDFDLYATCYPTRSTKVYRGQPEKEPGFYWEVTSKFSTKPRSRCQDESVEDPLLEPQKISGTFSSRTKQAFFDKDDNAILSSSHERLFLEVDDNRPDVTISQNVASLGLETFSEMVDTLNDDTLWGLTTRKIKLSNVSWSREYWGLCDVYYTRTFEFDVNFKTFDEDIMDVGTMHVKDGGNKTLIADFIQNKDDLDENLGTKLPLDGDGNVAANAAAAATITPLYYPESNFLLLGIPTTL